QPRGDPGIQTIQTDDDDLLDGSILVQCCHFGPDPGRIRRTRLRPNSMMLRPNIITTPATAAITDATGIIVSGPKYANSISRVLSRTFFGADDRQTRDARRLYSGTASESHLEFVMTGSARSMVPPRDSPAG